MMIKRTMIDGCCEEGLVTFGMTTSFSLNFSVLRQGSAADCLQQPRNTRLYLDSLLFWCFFREVLLTVSSSLGKHDLTWISGLC